MGLTLDMSYRQARPFVLFKPHRIQITVAGVGGTGSHLVPFLPELARQLQRDGHQVSIALVDPDTVSEQNCSRQNFFLKDVGLNKATILAFRYGVPSGMPMTAVIDRFDANKVRGWQHLTVLVGCTDNSAARRELSRALVGISEHRLILYLDAGNSFDNGQVIIGTTADRERLRRAFATGVCTDLPAPAIQEPGLLDFEPDEVMARRRSCAELAAANLQSRTINMRMAAELAQYLQEVLIDGGLRRCATTIDLKTGTARSKYLTPQTLAPMLDTTPDFFIVPQPSEAPLSLDGLDLNSL
ncbi:MAG: ThiF family adenylyltransferase [Ktedonobacterales bacterium]|nr:ThiF family adenylyltransferase [Ktedonobacterales bacterium]